MRGGWWHGVRARVVIGRHPFVGLTWPSCRGAALDPAPVPVNGQPFPVPTLSKWTGTEPNASGVLVPPWRAHRSHLNRYERGCGLLDRT